MIFDLLKGDLTSVLIRLLLVMPSILIALTFHEFAHGFIANKLGDPTAKNLGRLTLNPLKHLDPIGTLMMLFVGIGYAKPVPINSRYFKKPKRDMALTALAGPAMNLILSFAGVTIYSVYLTFFGSNNYITYAVYVFFYYFAYLNAYLAIFNLMPIPPFDGSRIALVLLPDKYYWGIMKYERTIMIVTIVVLLGLSRIGLNPFSRLVELYVGGVEAMYSKIFALVLGH